MGGPAEKFNIVPTLSKTELSYPQLSLKRLSSPIVSRSPLQVLQPDIYSFTVVRGKKKAVRIDVMPEIAEAAKRSGIALDRAVISLSHSGPSFLSPLRFFPRMRPVVKVLSASGILGKERFELNQTNGQQIPLQALQDLSVSSGEKLGAYRRYNIVIREKFGEKSAAVILTVGNHETFNGFLSWYYKQQRNTEWQKSLVTPCPAYDLEKHQLIPGNSNCAPSRFRIHENGKYTVRNHPWPANHVGIEARQNPRKGDSSGGNQEIYVCGPGETICKRSTDFPTAGTADRVSPKDWFRGIAHLVADVFPGRTAQIFDGFPEWRMPISNEMRSVRPGRFLSMYLACRPISPEIPGSAQVTFLKNSKEKPEFVGAPEK